jgi:spoIIIJ-associated protein
MLMDEVQSNGNDGARRHGRRGNGTGGGRNPHQQKQFQGGPRHAGAPPRRHHNGGSSASSVAVAAPEPPEVAPVKDLLVGILSRMGVGPVDIIYHVRAEGEYLEVRGSELAGLIGRHGNTLEALNLVFNNIVNAGQRNSRRYYTIDAEGYRARRADALKSLALQTLERAVRERKAQILEPMLPSERKIIHIALTDSPFVATESTGVEPERRVVVTPK